MVHNGPDMAADEVTKRLPVDRSTWAAGLHERRIKHLQRSMAYRVAFGAVGAVVLAVGIVTIPLPGPGWATVFVGLGMLALEFTWAERLALVVLAGLQLFWTRWLEAPAWQRAIGLVVLLLITAFAVMLSASIIGAPDFVPKLW